MNFASASASTMPEKVLEYQRGEFLISTDRARLDLNVIYGFLTNCYWSKGIPQEVVARSIEHSYLGDVFVLESYRGLGLSKWLMECIMQHPALQNLRRWILLTRDAHGLYSQFGFTTVKTPERYMELHRPNIYEAP